MTQGIARRLNRTRPHREALLRNLCSQLFQHGAVTTTHAKCKEAQRRADRCVTWAKRAAGTEREDGDGAKARAVQLLQKNLFLSGDNAHLVKKLVEVVAPRMSGRNGGYTRVLRLESRQGDRAPQSILELVEGVGQTQTMKFWMLNKSILQEEAQNGAQTQSQYNALTLRNLYKIARLRQDREQLVDEILQVRKALGATKIEDSAHKTKIRTLLDLAQVQGTAPPSPPQQSAKRGYTYVSCRPQRPSA